MLPTELLPFTMKLEDGRPYFAFSDGSRKFATVQECVLLSILGKLHDINANLESMSSDLDQIKTNTNEYTP